MSFLVEKRVAQAIVTPLGRCATNFIRQPVRVCTAKSFRLDVRYFQTSDSRARQTSLPEASHPQTDRIESKVYGSADDAVADLKDGATILSAGFGLCGVAGKHQNSDGLTDH